jgi:hypothetical protein
MLRGGSLNMDECRFSRLETLVILPDPVGGEWDAASSEHTHLFFSTSQQASNINKLVIHSTVRLAPRECNTASFALQKYVMVVSSDTLEKSLVDFFHGLSTQRSKIPRRNDLEVVLLFTPRREPTMGMTPDPGWSIRRDSPKLMTKSFWVDLVTKSSPKHNDMPCKYTIINIGSMYPQYLPAHYGKYTREQLQGQVVALVRRSVKQVSKGVRGEKRKNEVTRFGERIHFVTMEKYLERDDCRNEMSRDDLAVWSKGREEGLYADGVTGDASDRDGSDSDSDASA